jgi:Xaa-Pro dipeptidase
MTAEDYLFSKAEYDRRFASVRKILEMHHLPALVCYGNRGAQGVVQYLTNFSPRWDTYLLFPLDGEPVLFIQLYNHAPNAQRLSILADTRWGGANSEKTLAEEIQGRSLMHGRLGLAGALPYQRYGSLGGLLPDVKWIDVSKDLGRLRWIKSEEELSLMRKAAELTDLAVAALAEGVRPGLRDRDLPVLMKTAVLPKGGLLDLCYLASTSMRDPSICVPAQNPSGRVIQNGDVIITEIGVSWKGYAGQIHRPIAVGEPPVPAYQRLYDVALKAYQGVAEVIRPGATEQDVLDAAEIIHQNGFTIYDDLVHGFGGGYLPPVLRTRRTTHDAVEPFVFEKNMCIVVQPNVISQDERMGLQLGQLHLVTDSGLEPMHRYPLEFIVAG